jgi:hypothetical protein
MDAAEKDYIQRKARQLDLGRGHALTVIQNKLDGDFQGQVRAVSLNAGILKLATPNASLASELRFRQLRLVEELRKLVGAREIKGLSIQIRSLI